MTISIALKFEECLEHTSLFLQARGVRLPESDKERKRRIEYLENKLKQKEAELRHSKLRVFRAFHCSHIAQIITGPFSEIKEVNGKFCELLGYSKEELIGKTVADLTKHNQEFVEAHCFHEEVRDKLKSLKPNESIPTWEKIFIKKSGQEIVTFVSIFPILKDWHNVHYYVGRDVRPKCFAPAEERCMWIQKARKNESES